MDLSFNPYKTGYDIVEASLPGESGLARAYGTIAAFLAQFPSMQAAKNQSAIDAAFLRRHVHGFIAGRQSQGPVLPGTIPDARIKDVLALAYQVPEHRLEEAVHAHMAAMGAENFIGWALEAYIASEAEPLGWVWCSGAMIRAVDFIQPVGAGIWKMLQVKNRSNSENSSSSRVREGTAIEKWFRVYAQTGDPNWGAFPDLQLRARLSEAKFREFLINWLQNNFLQQP